MSSECNYFSLTEDERRAGIGSFLSENNNAKVIYDSKYTIRQQEIIKIIADLDETQEIKIKSINKVFSDGISFAINTYAEKENLSLYFLNIAQQDTGLTILLKGYLTKKCFFILDNQLIISIDNFVKSLYKDITNDIVYDRVTKVQNFIHFKVQEKYGIDAHLELNKSEIKDVLSTVRLHLEIRNIRYKNINHLLSLNEKTKILRRKEGKKHIKVKLLRNQKYVPFWRVKHLNSLIEYIPSKYMKEVLFIAKIPIIQPSSSYKDAIISIIN